MKYFLRSLLIGLLCLAPLSTDATQRVAALISPQAINADLGFVQVGNVGNLSVMGAPSGATFSLLTNPGGHFSIVGTEIVAEPSTPAGQYSLSIQATGTGYSVSKTFVLNYNGLLPSQFAVAFNLSGAENSFPAFSTIDQLTYFKNLNFVKFRYPISWSQLNTQGQYTGIQHALNTSLDASFASSLDGVLSNMAILGQSTLIDVHTFAVGPGLTGPFSISALTSSGTTISATYSATTPLAEGSTVQIQCLQNACNQGYAGSFTISNVTPTTFQYTASVAPTVTSNSAALGLETAFIGSARLPASAFASLWTGISQRYKGNVAVRGYDLVNEPPNGFNSTTWFNAAQSAINAIRANGDTKPIYVEGVNFSGSWNWVTGQGQSFNNSLLYQLVDSANNLFFSSHEYFDNDSSGGNFSWNLETAKPGAAPPGTPTSVTIGNVTRAPPFIAWCEQFSVRCHFGETGTSSDPLYAGGANDYQHWNATLDNDMGYLQAHDIEFTYWGGGAGFGAGPNGYPFNPEPFSAANPSQKDFSSAGVQAPQMAVLKRYNGFVGSEPTAYALFQPQLVTATGNPEAPIVTPILYGSNGAASAPFRVYYGGKITSTVTITPHAMLLDGTAAGGTFTPTTMAFAPGENAQATFTYTPSQANTFKISTTNNGGWTDPPAVGYSTSTDNFNTIAGVENVYGLRGLYTPYIGPALRLQRVTDNQQMDWYLTIPNANGTWGFDRAAIQTWASARNGIPIVTVYDQGPKQQNITNVNTPIATLNLNNAAGYPEIVHPTNAEYHFQTTVGTPFAGNTQQTVLGRISDSNNGAFFVSMDNVGGPGPASFFPFRFAPSGYQVNNNSATVTMNREANVYHTYGATYSNNTTTNGAIGYRDGSVISQATTPNSKGLLSSSSNATVGYFGFFPPSQWTGSWQNLVIESVNIGATSMGAFATSDATYYSTPLPDSLPAIPPTISGAMANQTIFPGAITARPFSTMVMQDQNSGTPTDTATITLSGAAGTLAGSGISGSGPYTIGPDTAANVTAALNGAIFTTAAGAGSTTNFSVFVSSSAGTNATDNNSSTIVTPYMAQTPFAAPVGTFTPVNFKGWNLSGMDNEGPTNGLPPPSPFQMDYVNTKGFGLIRLPITSKWAFTTAFGLLNSTYINLIKGVLDYAFTKNIYVVLDFHEFGQVWDSRIGAKRVIIPGTIGEDLFFDEWRRAATLFKNYPNLIMGLMNEPVGMSVAQWRTSAGNVVPIIRGAGALQTIFIPGGNTFTAAGSWVTSGNGAAWAGFTDTASNFMFEMHQYLDSSNQGNTPIAVVGRGATILSDATGWLTTNSFRGALMEFGIAPDPWLPSASNILAYDSTASPITTHSLSENGDMLSVMSANPTQWPSWAAFSGGYQFGTPTAAGGYAFNPEPNRNGTSGYFMPIVDQPQMPALQSHIFLLKRDLDPASNDNDPMWLEKAA